MLEIVDVVASELDAGQLEEFRPSNALDPLAHALILLCVRRPDLDDVLHRVHHLGPAGRVVGEEGDGQLGECL